MSFPQVWKAHALTLGTLPVPKARRPRFELTLRVVDLNNVPLVSGTCFIKWHLPSSTAAEHRGRTAKCTIKDHKVNFDYDKQIPVRLIVGKDQMLQETWIHFEVIQEYSSGGKGERLGLGSIKLNLAEYVEASEQSHGKDEEGVTRRYLMQESKINSTLKIGICMRHIEGSKEYYAPPLRTAPVFGGIAGIMAQEAAADSSLTLDPSDPSHPGNPQHMPSLSSKSRDAGEMQDMYRRTLAASWVAQPGELKADECIEDIFSGGDGWGSHLGKPKGARGDEAVTFDDHEHNSTNSPGRGTSANLEVHAAERSPRSKSPRTKFFGGGGAASAGTDGGGGTGGGHKYRHSKDKSLDSTKRANGGFGEWGTPGGNPGPGNGGLSKGGIFGGRTSLQQQIQRVETEQGRNRLKKKEKKKGEVDEFDNEYRQDLRAWNTGRDGDEVGV